MAIKNCIGIANAIGFKNQRRGVILPQWFKDSLVCWYDVDKQKATNESLKANPLLKDFSKNHLDMTLHNFKFKGMSGIGGYNLTFDDFYVVSSHPERQDNKLISPYKFIIINQNAKYIGNFAIKAQPQDNIKMKIRVTGLSEDNHLVTSDYKVNIDKDGEYEIDYINENVQGISFALKEIQQNANVTIEIIPYYPGALVFDGVDDYGISENQPELTDYTVIAKRKIICEGSYFISKSISNNNDDSAFCVESTSKNASYSFGYKNTIKVCNTDIVYQTKHEYCNQKINSANAIDTSYLYLGCLRPSGEKWNGAFYQALIFNRTLTPEEIDWVKFNIMQPEWFVKNLVCWYSPVKQGASNYSLKKNPILKDFSKNHLDMSLHNFNYSQDSGINGNGALVFDGVDDYGISENQPELNDYTIVSRRKFLGKGYYLASKSKVDSSKDGAFMFEGITPNATYSYGTRYSIGNKIPEDISWQTKNSYNGNLFTVNNEIKDSDTLFIGKTRIDTNMATANMALYDFLQFKKSLTIEQIDWIKDNCFKNPYRLPKGYKQLDYIENTSNAYIDTGLLCDMGKTYEIQYQKNEAKGYRIWGALNQESYVGQNYSLTWGGINGTIVRCESRKSGESDIKLAYWNTKKHTVILSPNGCMIDGANKGLSTGFDNDFCLDYNAYLFSLNPANTTPITHLNGKIFSYKVFDKNDKLIQYFKPCISPDNEVGMYDVIDNKFYKSANATKFIAGNQI